MSEPTGKEQAQRLFDAFTELGFMKSEALALAVADADPTVVREKLAQGCPHTLAVAIYT